MKATGKLAIILPLMALLIVSAPSSAFADGHTTVGGQAIELPNPLGNDTTITSLLDKLLDLLAIQLGPVIAAIMIIIGAFQMLFAGGDPEKFSTGKRTIIYTTIAYGILLMAKGIVLIIKDFLS